MSLGKMVGKVFRQAQAQKAKTAKPKPGLAGVASRMQNRVKPQAGQRRGIGGMIERARTAQAARPAAPAAKPQVRAAVSGQVPSRAARMRSQLQKAKMAPRPTAQSNTQDRIKQRAAQPAAVSGRQPPARPAGGGSFGRGGSRRKLY